MITTKGRYALRVMLDLAQRHGEDAVPLKEIAERQDISKKYLEAIVRELVRAGLIRGASGKGGGYVLCRAPGEYSVGEILAAAEGSLAVVSCLSAGAEPCSRAAQCETLPLWNELDRLIHSYLESKKLSDLLNNTTQA